MKMQLAVIVACALAAGPAAAQGTFSPGGQPGSTFGSGAPSMASKPKTYVPPAPAPAARPRIYGAPEAPNAGGFEPYKPFSGSSVYARPSGSASSGAKPCETSVYTNACGNKR